MINLIGLYSPAMGMGKTALTNVLMEDHGWAHVNFAGTLKRMLGVFLQDLLGVSEEGAEEYTYGSKKEELLPILRSHRSDPTTRSLMQTLGTEWGRGIVSPTIWVDLAKAKIQRLMADGWKVVVDDMRFPNEFDAIKALGGATVKVIRPGVEVTSAHASEGALNGHHFDFELRNEHGLAEWEDMAHHFHETLANRGFSAKS